MAHRYWRILFTAGAASNEVDLGWVKFYTTVDVDGTTTSATATGGTAISGENFSGSYLPSKSFTYTNAEQGDLWASTNNGATWGTTKWIGYDFGGSPQDIVAYGFVPYSTTYAPSAWLFQYSDDGSSWTTVDTVTGWTFQFTNIEIFRCPSSVTGTGYRYWRVYFSGSGSGGAIGELSLRTTTGGSNVLSSLYSSLYADSVEGGNYSTYGPRKVLDGNTGFLSYTWRATAASTAAHWWMVDFGKKITLAEAVMTGGITAEMRGSIVVQASNDKSVWITYGTFPTFTADYQQRTLTLAAPAGLVSRRRPIIIAT